MKKNFSQSKTPQTNESWKKISEKERIEILYKDLEVIKAPENGQVIVKIEKIMPANKRGILLLELEEKLKLVLDQGITIWCEPVGDKSKLRGLRGVEIKT